MLNRKLKVSNRKPLNVLSKLFLTNTVIIMPKRFYSPIFLAFFNNMKSKINNILSQTNFRQS